MAGTVRDALTVAAREIGYREGRGNRTKFGKWYGMNGVAWCAEFVSWVMAHAGVHGVPKYAYCPAGADYFKRHGRWGHTPRPGAIVFFYFGHGRISHTGIVEKVLPGGKIQTIEGNTSPSNARNGGGVYRMRRSTRRVAGYGYPQYNTAKAAPKKAVAKKPATKKPVPAKTAPKHPVKHVKATTLNVRNKASLIGKVIAQVHKDDRLIILAANSKWYKVKTPSGLVGFVSRKYVG